MITEYNEYAYHFGLPEDSAPAPVPPIDPFPDEFFDDVIDPEPGEDEEYYNHLFLNC